MIEKNNKIIFFLDTPKFPKGPQSSATCPLTNRFNIKLVWGTNEMILTLGNRNSKQHLSQCYFVHRKYYIDWPCRTQTKLVTAAQRTECVH